MTSWTLALRDIPRPDYAHTVYEPLPPDAPVDPQVWAERLFAVRTMPRWVVAAMAVRQALVPLLGIRPGARGIFAVRETAADEALIAADDRHLDFRCGVAVDAETRILRVTTTVRLHGWRGRLYFLPVRVAHPVVMRSMIRAARRAAS